MAQLNDPIPQEWTDFVTQSPVALEVIQDALYDTLVYTSASTTEQIFFAQSIATVTRDKTNMTQPGMLPNPESFLIQCPRFYVKWTASAISAGTFAATVGSDLVILSNTAIVTMQFGNKRYGPWPLSMMNCGMGVKFQMSNNATAPVFTAYAQLDGPLWGLFPNVMISPLQSFNVTINWPAGAVTLGAGNPSLSFILEGQRARAVQ
jgi:hypothetical protein